jgi:hypothetical protein
VATRANRAMRMESEGWRQKAFHHGSARESIRNVSASFTAFPPRSNQTDLTVNDRMRNNRAVPRRRRLATALLLLAAAAMPQLLWLGAHALGHHEHGEETASHAMALAHGHEHGEGVPDHEHYLRTSSPLRPDVQPDLQAPVVVSLAALEPEHAPLSNAGFWRGETRLAGASPPRLHLLCTLLI